MFTLTEYDLDIVCSSLCTGSLELVLLWENLAEYTSAMVRLYFNPRMYPGIKGGSTYLDVLIRFTFPDDVNLASLKYLYLSPYLSSCFSLGSYRSSFLSIVLSCSLALSSYSVQVYHFSLSIGYPTGSISNCLHNSF